jgi:hypothetical protein
VACELARARICREVALARASHDGFEMFGVFGFFGELVFCSYMASLVFYAIFTYILIVII